MSTSPFEDSGLLPDERVAFQDRLETVLSTRANTGPTGLITLRFDLVEARGRLPTDLGLVGEALIAEASDRIAALLADDDEAARFGLDEIAIIRPTVAAPAEAESLAMHLLDSLKKPFGSGRADDPDGVFVPCSIGVATSIRGDSAQALALYAEHALANAVVLGGFHVATFDDADRELFEVSVGDPRPQT